MKKVSLKPSSLSIVSRPDGGGVLSFQTVGDIIDIELSSDLWQKLEESTKWHAGQKTNGHSRSAEDGVLDRFEALLALDLDARVKALEVKLK